MRILPLAGGLLTQLLPVQPASTTAGAPSGGKAAGAAAWAGWWMDV